jgi:hypothetical protein
MSNKLGRPVTETEKRDQFIRLRFTKTEIEAIKLEAESLSISYSSYLRSKALNGKKHTLNGKVLITSLDALGSELGRSGNNINQLAKHANILNKTGKLDESIINRFNVLFADYIKSQQEMEVVIRKIIREARG